MTTEQKLELVDALIKEDENATLADFISVVQEVEFIERSVLFEEFRQKCLGIKSEKVVFTGDRLRGNL